MGQWVYKEVDVVKHVREEQRIGLSDWWAVEDEKKGEMKFSDLSKVLIMEIEMDNKKGEGIHRIKD